MLQLETKTKFKDTEIGPIPMEWEISVLGNHLELLTDYHANGSYEVLKKNVELKDQRNYAAMIRTTNFEQGNFESGALKYIDEHAYNFLKKSKVSPGDIIMNKIANAGSIYRMPNLNMPVSLAMNLFLIKTNNTLHQHFAFYFLRGIEFIIKSRVQGTTSGTITKENVRAIPMVIPPLAEQKSIAEILSSLDEKIELNRRMNKTLEEIGKVLFKRWFVDFEFPNEDGKPYKSSGGEMVDSELGEIPEGWDVEQLNKFTECINGYSYKGSELRESSDKALVTLKSFDRVGGFQVKGFKPFSGTPKSNQEVLLGDLVVAHTDLTQNAEVVGNPALIFNDAGYKKMFITMDLVKITSKFKETSIGFFYYLMKTHNFKKHCLGYVSGTTVLHLSKKAIPEYKFALPKNKKLIQEFSNTINTTINEIINNISQNEKLLNLSDSLLPKLISGKLRTVKI